MKMCWILTVGLSLFFSLNCHAACSDTMTGQTAQFQVVISDDDCGYDQEMIRVWKFDDDGSIGGKPAILVPFSKECQTTETGFHCHRAGKTPLAGTTYKKTNDTNPRCAGVEIGTRLTCVSGCTKRAPRYFYISGYEC